MKSIAATDARSHRQLFSLNLIRAVAIVMVVLDHCFGPDTDPDIRRLAYLVMNPNAALFFMLSGALLLPVGGSYSHFIRRRVMRVLVPYVIWVIIYALVWYWLDIINQLTLANQIRWSWMSYNFGSGWFIPTIMSLYLIMPLLSPWIASATRRRFHYVLIVWLVAGLMPYCVVFGGVHENNNLVSSFLTAMPYAVIGYYLTRYRNRQPLLPSYVLPSAGDSTDVAAMRRRVRRRKLVVLYSLAILVGIIIPFALRDSFTTADFIGATFDYSSLPCIVMAILWFTLLLRVRTLGSVADRVVNFISRYSYAVYLNHWLLVKTLIPRYAPELTQSVLLTFAVTFGLSLILASVMRRIPFVGRYLG